MIRRLIEVDLPIRTISAHARREKSIRHGYISTLHLWWARRPLAACRAVLCAALWPDPADSECPPAFRQAAARIINGFAQRVLTDRALAESCSPGAFGRWNALSRMDGQLDPAQPPHLNVLRYALLDFIGDFADWDNSTVSAYLETSRALTQAAHEALGGLPGTRPLVVDPFAGGGAIPLEALRVGADAFASDLNPVAVLLNKVLLEFIPKYGQQLADEVRKWGAWVKEQAENELTQFYPANPQPAESYAPQVPPVQKVKGVQWQLEGVTGEAPIAYLWARTIRCEGPGCGGEVPLMRSLWLAKKGERSVALQLVIDRTDPYVDFEIIEKRNGQWVRTANPGQVVKEPQFAGTVKRGSATCPVCGYTTPVVRVRAQLKARQGGGHDARLLAVVVLLETMRRSVQTNESKIISDDGRFYRLPTGIDQGAIKRAAQELEIRRLKHGQPLSLVPNELFPTSGLRRIQVPNYGIEAVGDMFTPRQALSIVSLVSLIAKVDDQQDNSGLSVATKVSLALLLDKQIDLGNSLNRWEPVAQCPRQLFARQSVPIVWDFAESVPISSSSGSWSVLYRSSASVLASHVGQWQAGTAEQASALRHPLPDDSASLVFTDPPYYDSVVYAHTADVFYPWLRRQLSAEFPHLFGTELTPKEDEIVVDPPHSLSPSKKDARFFETKMAEALSETRRLINSTGLAVVVFAHQSTSGWEAMIGAVLEAGYVVTGSWPIDTEMATRVIAQGRAVLASSIHLVCRPRAVPLEAISNALERIAK